MKKFLGYLKTAKDWYVGLWSDRGTRPLAGLLGMAAIAVLFLLLSLVLG